MKFVVFPLELCLLIFGFLCISADAQEKCDWLRAQVGTRTEYSGVRANKLLAVKKVKGKIAANLPKHKAEEGNGYYFVMADVETKVIVSIGGDQLLEINVPRYAYRPMKAHWVNEKLLYLGSSFNPHYSAYWIYDVDVRKVVTHELINDGYAAWDKCLSKMEKQRRRSRQSKRTTH